VSSPADHRAFLSSQLKCAHLVPAKAPLSEEAIFNQKQAVVEKRCAKHKAQHKKCQIAKCDRNDNHNKRWKAGELGVSSDEDPSPSLRGVEMSPARRSTGATCRGRPHRRLPVALKFHRRADHQRPEATRPLAQAHAKWLAPREMISGWPAHAQYLAERVPLSRRNLRLGKPIPRDGRRSG
jgi:uncharacterized low-complexity protein